PENDLAKTEATVPVKPVEDEEEDWTDEIRQAALPVAQASEKPSAPKQQAQPLQLPAKAAPSSTVGNGRGGDVRPDTDLTPRGKNPGAMYPQTARLQKLEGTSVLRFKVDGNGNVADAWVHKSSGFKSFDQEALKTQRSWKYLPGKSGTFQKPWVFRLKGNPEEMPYRIRR
ncbi:MAG: TonB family protein, partial [Bdellovibrionia bacterium]